MTWFLNSSPVDVSAVLASARLCEWRSLTRWSLERSRLMCFFYWMFILIEYPGFHSWTPSWSFFFWRRYAVLLFFFRLRLDKSFLIDTALEIQYFQIQIVISYVIYAQYFTSPPNFALNPNLLVIFFFWSESGIFLIQFICSILLVDVSRCHRLLWSCPDS